MNRAEKYIKFLIYLAVIVLINVVGVTLFFRIDLTENNIYSLSKASKKAVSTLSEPMTIKVFFTENLPAPHNNTQRYLRDLLKEYSIHANENFNYRFYDVSPKEKGVSSNARENQELAKNYGIRPVQIRSVEQDEIKFKNAYMGLVLIHGDLIEKIPAITSTEKIEYQLTTAINKLNNKISQLAGLDEKVKIKLIMSASLETVAPYMGLKELPRLPEKIREAVNELNDKNYNKLVYEHVDPGQGDELDAMIARYDVMSLKWPDIAEENIDAGRGAIDLVMEYKDNVKDVQLLDIVRMPLIGTRYELIDTENLNELINENIETLIGINEDLGYLADHGTPSLMRQRMRGQQQGESLRHFNMHLSETYSIKRVNLKDEPIPESLNCLVIAQPTKAFSDYELYKIDQALMRGTNLAIFSDAYKEMAPQRKQRFNFQQPGYEPVDTGLKKLLAHYGIRLRDAFVMDKNCYKQTMSQRAGGGEQPIYYAPIIKNRHINNDLDFMKSIKGMISLQNSPLELVDGRIKKQGITAHSLFASSEASWLKSGKTRLNPLFIQPPKTDTDLKSYPLAYLLEGKFRSYFEGKPIPAKKTEASAAEESKPADEEGPPEKANEPAPTDAEVDLSKIESEKGFTTTGQTAKLAVVGSSAILKDNLVDQEGRNPNTTFLLNIIDVLNHRGEIAAMRSKTQRFNPLEETTAMTKTTVKIINIAGLPVLVVLFGLFTWWRRRMRRRRIQMMFQV
ncbi:MAG: Gldg family protein [Desulfobacterales bacterium]|nr:Gldg family protein [Desulfobacterales bacterium]